MNGETQQPGWDLFGGLQALQQGLTRNLQTLLDLEGKHQGEDTSAPAAPHLESWRKDRGLIEAQQQLPSAVLDGETISVVGLRLARRHAVVRGKAMTAALIVEAVEHDSEAHRKGVKTGEVVLMVGIVSAATLRNSELVELLNHTLALGEPLRMSFASRGEEDPYSIWLGGSETRNAERTGDKNTPPYLESWRAANLKSNPKPGEYV